MKWKALRYWTYFKRAHSNYFAYFISFANFVVIQYALLVERLGLFSSFLEFALLFALTYVPLCVVVGWLDYRKLAYPIEATIHAESNPWIKDLAKALQLIAQGKNEEAIKLLEKWTRHI